MTTNVSDTWEDLGDTEKIPTGSPIQELGVTGIKRTGGYIDEEFLPALRGRKAVRVFREMASNDSMVGALLFAIDKLIREVEWRVEPADQTPEGQLAAEFLESNRDDMSHSWDDFIGEVLSMLTFGWSWHEIVYKRRLGPWEKDGSRRSQHTDGLIGWRKMPIRSQETLMRWVFDETGGIKGMVQMAPPSYKATALPIEKCLLFRTSIAKGNPEGLSLLRSAYRAWYFKKRLEEFEAIGVERDLAGMPVAKVPADFLNAQPGTPQHKTVEAFRKMVRGVRRDENEGLVLPIQYDPDTKMPLFEFELMASAGSRTFDTNAIIQRYEQRILMAVLADFILVGHQQTGSYALHTDKTGIFRAALNAIVKAIADTLNRHAVPRLFEVNGWKLDDLPKFEPTDVDPPDLTQLAQFITSTAGAGMQWFPDPELEKFIREIARVPEMTEDVFEMKQAMHEQEQAMMFADTQMGLLSMKQRAEMVGNGYTPEQAMQAAEQPNMEMQGQMAMGEMEAEAARRVHPVWQDDRAREDEMMAMEQEQAAAQTPEQMALAEMEMQHERERAELQAQIEEGKFSRDKERMSLQEQIEQAKHGRQKEQLTLQEQMEQKKFQRTKESTKVSEKSADQSHRRSLQALDAKGKAEERSTKAKVLTGREKTRQAEIQARLAARATKEKQKQAQKPVAKKPAPKKGKK